MNRRTVLTVVVAVAVVGYVAYRLVSASPRQPPGLLHPVIERQVDGHAEVFTSWRRLETDSPPALDWSATWNANPAKPPFKFSLRSEEPSWGKKDADARSPVILECDGRTIKLPTGWGSVNVNGKAWSVVVAEGSLDDLSTAADSRKVRLAFGAHTGEMGEPEIGLLRELRRRASPAGGT